jgi:hypothetical protein
MFLNPDISVRFAAMCSVLSVGRGSRNVELVICTRYRELFIRKTADDPKLRRCIRNFPDCVDNETYAYSNKNSLRSKTKGYGGKTY